MARPTFQDKREQAAAELMKLLDERECFLIEQTCEGQQLSRWMYIVGILKRAIDTGEHTLPAVDPLWRSWTTWETKIIEDSECPVCHKKFTPRWRGQVYDCTECGALAIRTQLAAVAHPDSDRPSIGEESGEFLKSTIRPADTGNVPTMDEALKDAARALDEAIAEHASPGGLDEAPDLHAASE